MSPVSIQARCAAAASAGRCVAVESDRDVVEPAPEPARGDERIAAVVARPGEHEHARRRADQHVARDVCRREPRALHERLARGGALDRAQVYHTPDRLEAHAAIIG
jgi:hypothetical protein